MRRSNDQPLGDIIREFIRAYRLSDKLTEINIKAEWEKITGKVIANHTRNIYLMRRKLYVQVDSAALREELNMVRSRLLEALNKNFSEPVIDEIIIK